MTMNTNDAKDLLAKLLDAVADGDDGFVLEHNLTGSTVALLRKLTATTKEIESLESIVERRTQDEQELEQLLMVELQRLP